VLHPEEARKAVAAKPGSRYSDINVEDVPEPPADPMGEDPFGDGGDDEVVLVNRDDPPFKPKIVDDEGNEIADFDDSADDE
jgi:hypothetical protein